jgi:phosphatidylserine/phosphatidylglycerophosphate/cardiolipin synthase-like enzyme
MRRANLQNWQASHGAGRVEVMSVLVAVLLAVGLLFLPLYGTAATSFSAETTVYFSPNGGATEAIVRELSSAQHSIMVQAYSFTSAPIAKAILEAHKRGVKIIAVLDGPTKPTSTAQPNFPGECRHSRAD